MPPKKGLITENDKPFLPSTSLFWSVFPMPRSVNPDLIKVWKINLPATLAGKVEFILWDNLHGKPQYGERSKLIQALLTEWLARGHPRIFD